jgi:hypothetical protein
MRLNELIKEHKKSDRSSSKALELQLEQLLRNRIQYLNQTKATNQNKKDEIFDESNSPKQQS